MSTKLSLNYRYGVNSKAVLILLMALFFSLIFVMSCVIMPWFISLALVIVPLVLVLCARNPFAGLVLVLMLLFEVIPTILQPKLPIGGGGLTIYDVLIVFLTGVVLLKALWSRAPVFQWVQAVRWPLLYLYSAYIISIVYVKYFAPNPDVMTEARCTIVWLTVPLCMLSVDSPLRFRRYLWSVLIIGLIVAAYASIESIVQVDILTGARVEAMDASQEGDVLRVTTGGSVYIMLFGVLLFMNRTLDRRLSPLFTVPAVSLLLLGLAVQFGRGVWIAGSLGLMLSSFVHRGVIGLFKTAIVSSIFLALFLLLLGALKPDMAQALVKRAAGIGNEVESGGSFHWRLQENRYARIQIEKHPITGIGVGGEYKQTVATVGHFSGETRYIHNAYMYYPLKLGLWATFIPFSFMLAFIITLRNGVLKSIKATGDFDRGFIGALAGAFIVPVIASYTQPEWTNPTGIAALATLTSLALLYQRIGSVLLVDRLATKPSWKTAL